jgi:mono/diheme cytochrome c family protein
MILYRSVPAWLAIGAIIVGLATAAVPAASQSDDENFGLPDGKGRDEVMSYCAACHSLKLVSQQKLPRYVWEELLVIMTQRHGMPKLPADEEKLVLNYLAQQLAPPASRRKF